jgi:deazaflavin-dependent oxidoreductase (nitroreductase family)
MGVVIHTGRKTKRHYHTPVMVFRRGDRMIIALTYGRDSQWVHNVAAAGGCELETQNHKLRLSNPRLFHDNRRELMPGIVRLMLGILDVSDFLELTIIRTSGMSD